MVHYYQLELEVIGPVLTKSSLPGEPGLDAVALRDLDGSLLLNGKHMEGRARHAACDLAELSGDHTLKTWATHAFGPESEEKREVWEPVRGDITFEDLRCYAKPKTSSPQPVGRDFRLQIDEGRGTGEDRMLAVLERAAAHGETLTFCGLVRIAVTRKTAKEDHAANLLRCLRWITSVGGEAGIGYGALQSVQLQPRVTPPGATDGPALDGESVNLAITFTAPFCLAKPQLNQNIYEGMETVPGNAIAGAIMRAFKDAVHGHSAPCFPTLKFWFDKIHFRHAFPVAADSTVRPMVVPLSWVSVSGTLVEAALTPGPALFKPENATAPVAPKFATDWKTEDDEARELLHHVKVKHELRTYTRINRDTGVAMDNNLYSYELVRPEGLTWLSSLELSEIKDAGARAELLRELKQLLNESPLLFGKTSARAMLALDRTSEPGEVKPQTQDGRDLWILLLLTPALLVDAHKLLGAGPGELHAAYQQVWQEYSNLLKLERYFTGESLVGGDYLYRRFQNINEIDYFPYLLSDEGSVFVLSSAPEKQSEVKADLQRLLQQGLGLPGWAVRQFAEGKEPSEYWKYCPFLPQNGYGEISVNRQEQLARLPERMGILPFPFNTVSTESEDKFAEVQA